MSSGTPESRLDYLEDLIPKMRQQLEKQTELIIKINNQLKDTMHSKSVCACESCNKDKWKDIFGY
jgi:hypothetical protein